MRSVDPAQLELDLSICATAETRPAPERLTLEDGTDMIETPVRDKRYRLTAVGQVVADYLTWKEIEDGAAARTLDQYERDLSRLCLDNPRAEVEELTTAEYRRVIASFPAGSRKRVTAVFRDFSRWLYQESRVDLDVMGRVRYPRAKRQTVIDVFSEAECIRLLQQPDRDRALIRLLLEAGLRKGEARRLQLRHLDVEQSRLVILEGKGGKDRVIPIPPDLVEQLVALAIRDGIGSDDHLWYATRTNQHGDPRLHRERPIGEATFAAGGAPAATVPASRTATLIRAGIPTPPAGYATAAVWTPSPRRSATPLFARPSTSTRTSRPRTSLRISPA